MDPKKLQSILNLCEKIQEVSAEIYEIFAVPLKNHEDMMPDPIVLESMPLEFMHPDLVKTGHLPPATKKPTDDQITTLAKYTTWCNSMYEDLYNSSSDMVAFMGSMDALTNRLNTLIQSMIDQDLDGND